MKRQRQPCNCARHESSRRSRRTGARRAPPRHSASVTRRCSATAPVQPNVLFAQHRRRKLALAAVVHASQTIEKETARIDATIGEQDQRRDRPDLRVERRHEIRQSREKVGRQRRVGIQEQHPGSVRHSECAVLSATESLVAGRLDEFTRHTAREGGAHSLPGVISRCVVDDNQLERRRILHLQAREAGVDHRRAVPCHDLHDEAASTHGSAPRRRRAAATDSNTSVTRTRTQRAS